MLQVTFCRPDACQSCGACEGGKKQTTIWVKGEAKVGDIAVVDMPDKTVIRASLIAYGLPLILLLRLLFGGDRAAFLRRLFPTIGAVYLILLIYSPMIALFNDLTPFLFLFFILTTKAMDTGGYVFGLLSNRLMPGGNHKIAPTISPKKSWEGFFGGILLALAVAAAFIPYFSTTIPWWKLLALAPILALGSFFGDLTESALKRAADIKDSGNYIPGMGGIFDVLDSFIYNGWIFYLLKDFLI